MAGIDSGISIHGDPVDKSIITVLVCREDGNSYCLYYIHHARVLAQPTDISDIDVDNQNAQPTRSQDLLTSRIVTGLPLLFAVRSTSA